MAPSGSARFSYLERHMPIQEKIHRPISPSCVRGDLRAESWRLLGKNVHCPNGTVTTIVTVRHQERTGDFRAELDPFVRDVPEGTIYLENGRFVLKPD